MRFFVELLSQTSEGRQLSGVETRERFLENEAVRDKWKKGADDVSADQNHQTLKFKMESSRTRNEKNQSGESAAPFIIQQEKPRLRIDPSMKAGLPGSSDFVTEESFEHQLLQANLVPVQTDGLAIGEVSDAVSPKSSQKVGTRMDGAINELLEESDRLRSDTFVGGKSGAQRNGGCVTELEQKLASLREQSSKVSSSLSFTLLLIVLRVEYRFNNQILVSF